MTEARAVFEERVPELLAARPDLAERVDALLEVEVTGEGGGLWAIDLRRGTPSAVRPGGDPAAACRIRLGHADFADLLAGRRRWTDAFVGGRIAIEGDLVTALKLRRLFAGETGSG
jgi:SCP-2 sterol transfer family